MVFCKDHSGHEARLVNLENENKTQWGEMGNMKTKQDSILTRINVALCTLAVVLILLVINISIAKADTQTINPLPGANSTFMDDNQTFLKDELAARDALKANLTDLKVISGGVGATSASLTHTIPAIIAFPNGYYVSNAAISHTYTASTRTFVYVRDSDTRIITIAGAAITYNGNFVFAEMAAASGIPTLQTGLLSLFSASTNETAITSITNYCSSGSSNIYYPDYFADDQGITGDSNTIKYYIDLIGSTNATIFLKHNSPLTTTTYTFNTSETIPSNITLKIEPGAIIAIATGVTLTINGPLDVLHDQHIFNCVGTGKVMGLKEVTPDLYGAVGDGVTDDTSAFVALFSSLAEGSVIYGKPFSEYLITAGITTTVANVTMKSSGGPHSKPTLICATASETILTINTSGWKIDGWGFEGDGGVRGVDATVIGVVARGYFNTPDYDNDTDFVNCSFKYLVTGVIQKGKNTNYHHNIFSNSSAGIKITTADVSTPATFRGAVIQNNRFHSLGGVAVGGSTVNALCVEIESSDNFREFIFQNNYIDDSADCISGFATSMVITNNTYERGNGFFVDIDSTGHTYTTDKRLVKITENIISYWKDTNIADAITVTGSARWEIRNNFIYFVGQSAIIAESTTNVTIAGNNIYQFSINGAYPAILTDATTYGCDIYDNVIDAGTTYTTFTYGISVLGYGTSGINTNYIGKNKFKNTDFSKAYKIERSSTLYNVGEPSLVSNSVVIDEAWCGDADCTVTVAEDAMILRHTTTLTADRTVTVDRTTNVYDGALFRILRPSAGAFNLIIDLTYASKNLAIGDWIEIMYSGEAGNWIFSGQGSLL